MVGSSLQFGGRGGRRLRVDSIRVLVTDDSALARAVLREVLESGGGIEVVAEAANGREAVEMVRRHHPDLVTMDLEMPVMGGLDAIAEIMAVQAVPILVVSAIADAQKAYEAVSRGALEVIDKPGAGSGSGAEFVAKVRLLSGIKVITHLRAGRPAPAPTPPLALAPASAPSAAVRATAGSGGWSRLFAIAASTGGPQVLAAVLSRLPPGFPCPLVVAQHISDGFAAGMAEWLAGICALRVELAVDGAPLRPGTAYLSPSEAHLAVTAGRRLELRPRGSGDIYRPSCDILLGSAAAACGRGTVGLILTGMGGDGAEGMARIRAAGGVTLAQDAESSVIFGMNRVAIERGAVQRVLPAGRIAAELLSLADAGESSRP